MWNLDNTAFADIYILKNDFKSHINLFKTNSSIDDTVRIPGSSIVVEESVLHGAGRNGSTEQIRSKINHEAYQITPRGLQRRKGGKLPNQNCCRPKATVVVGSSLGVRVIDGPGLAFWAGVAMAILFQVSVVLALA